MIRTKSIRIRKDPAFLLYSADFLVDTQFWSESQVGKYVRLLCYQHQTGHITEETMLYYCKERDEKIFQKFIKDENGLFFNKDLEDEITRRAEVSKSKSKNVNKRWAKDKNKDQSQDKKDKIAIDTYIPEYDD